VSQMQVGLQVKHPQFFPDFN